MSLQKKLLICAMVSSIVFVYGCGSKDVQQKSEMKKMEEQTMDMKGHEGHDMDMEGKEMKMEKSSTGEMVEQKTCPVMGNPVNKDLFVDYNGQRIYVCCTMCLDKVKEAPEKYIKKLEEMGQKPEKL